MRFKAKVGDPGDVGVLLEPFGKCKSIVAVALPTKTKGFETLEKEEGAEWVQRWTNVAEQLFNSEDWDLCFFTNDLKHTSVRTLMANAMGPKVSLNLRPWYPSEGSVNPGNFPDFVQSNFPESTMTPAMVVP